MRLRQTADQLIPELAPLPAAVPDRGRRRAAVSLIGWFMNPAQFFQSYLMAYMLVLGATLGCLALGMIHQLSGGAWGVVTRRLIGAASRVLPVVTLLFLPIVVGMPHLYEWTHADVGRRRRVAAPQGALPEHAVLPGARARSISRSGTGCRISSTSGRSSRTATGDPRVAAAHAGAERRRAARLRLHHHLRVVRLADVARPALVLDDLRRAGDGRAGADGDGGADHRARLVEPPAAARRRRRPGAFSRSRAT